MEIQQGFNVVKIFLWWSNQLALPLLYLIYSTIGCSATQWCRSVGAFIDRFGVAFGFALFQLIWLKGVQLNMYVMLNLALSGLVGRPTSVQKGLTND
jgi:hypothetical protein